MSCMLFSDRQRFVKRYVMMLSDINYFVTGKTRIIGKMTAKFSFFQISMHHMWLIQQKHNLQSCTSAANKLLSHLVYFWLMFCHKNQLKSQDQMCFHEIFEKICIVRVFFLHQAKFCLKFEQKVFKRQKHKVMVVYGTKILKYLTSIMKGYYNSKFSPHTSKPPILK